MATSLNRDAFIDGYCTAALWADGMPEHMSDTAELGGLEHLEMRADARDYMGADCMTFIDANGDDLIAYCERVVRVDEDPPEAYAGHDFWLTRRGHGCGFWDRGMDELGERLSEAARKFSSEPFYPYDCGDGTADVDRPKVRTQ